MPEQTKVRHLLRGLKPSLLEKVYPLVEHGVTNTQTLFQLVQRHSQASHLANNSDWSSKILPPTPCMFVTQEQLQKAITGVERKVEQVESKMDVQLKNVQSQIEGSATSVIQAVSDMFKNNAQTNTRQDNTFDNQSTFKRTHEGKPICNRCNRPGHIARIQPRLLIQIQLTNPQTKTKLVLKDVICCKYLVEAIIDTGSGITVVSPTFSKLLNIPLQPSIGPDILLADGQRTRPLGSINIEVRIDNVTVFVSAIVLQINGYDLLLGNDTLRQLNKEAHTIPAHSLVAIAVEQTKDVKSCGTSSIAQLLMIEPSAKVMNDKGVSTGRICFQSNSPPEIIYLINFSDSPQWISKDSKLGEIINVEIPDTKSLTLEEDTIDFENAINKELPEEDRQAIKDLLFKHRSCFAANDHDLGSSNLVQHGIDIGNHQPVHQAPYPSAWKQREHIEPQVKRMEDAGIIERSQSPFAAPVVLVRKSDGTWRFCIDYRRLNAITVKDVYPLPRIEDALSRLEGSKYFSLMDLQSGYWQVQMKPEDREKTAFITADGLYHFKVMPFGLTNAPSTFQRMMDVLLAGLKWNTCLVYLDDIVVFSDSFQQHLTRLEDVLQRLSKANLKLKPSKCTFAATRLKSLGYVVCGVGLSPDPSKIDAVINFPVPTSLKDLLSFIGLCSYYRRFIKDFAVIAKPLTNLSRKGKPFVWTSEQQNSFQTLKTALTSSSVLGHPNYELPMEIHCDACDYGIGAVLIQHQDGKERVLAYASRLLSSAERNYSITEKECLALVWSIQKFKIYVWGTKIRIITDHHALCWLMRKKDLAGRLARWSLQLQDLDIEIIHRSGRLHSDADTLSRYPTSPPEPETDIPMFYSSLPANINMRSLQMESNWYKAIISGLQETRPQKRVRHAIRHFVLRDGVLFHRVVKHGQVFHRLCIPQVLIEQVLLACHDDITAGHLGISRTLDKIHKRYFWPKMTQHITNYVRSCADCQSKKKPRERPAGYMQPIHPKQPFEKIGLDLIGPFPLSSLGNRHVIIAVDYLTKWVIAKAVPVATTVQIVDFFVRRIILQHGAPLNVISDRGQCLTSEFAEELFRALQSNHLVTTAYHPQCNGLVERFNHTFAEMLSMFVNSNHSNWDDVIDHVVFAYNTSKHESTGMTPFFLLYGREARLPIDVALGNNPNPVSTIHKFQLLHQLPSLREKVKRRLLLVQHRQKQRYDNRRKEKSYKVGDLVWVYRPIRKKGRSTKLLHRLSKITYEVRSEQKHKKITDNVHVCNLKPFYPRLPLPILDMTSPRKQLASVSRGAREKKSVVVSDQGSGSDTFLSIPPSDFQEKMPEVSSDQGSENSIPSLSHPQPSILPTITREKIPVVISGQGSTSVSVDKDKIQERRVRFKKQNFRSFSRPRLIYDNLRPRSGLKIHNRLGINEN
ncbi:pol polyprotein [Daphnia sinensis]|uniref:RNA-directed DNA polymerase n=1 Tax=Daphnia sinensis TaxID=1820382 RepID=A0AAD5PNQ9_9CRUS|nr:pol polyprotein [Daphnia sinensis]